MKVQRAGTRLRTEFLDVWIASSSLSYCRVAVVVGKYGHSIVERNRLRRQIREIARVQLIPFYIGVDLVIRPLSTAYTEEFNQLVDQISELRIRLSAVISEK